MKKLITILILAYLSFTINSSAITQEKLENKNILKIGVLLPLSGKFQESQLQDASRSRIRHMCPLRCGIYGRCSTLLPTLQQKVQITRLSERTPQSISPHIIKICQ